MVAKLSRWLRGAYRKICNKEEKVKGYTDGHDAQEEEEERNQTTERKNMKTKQIKKKLRHTHTHKNMLKEMK